MTKKTATKTLTLGILLSDLRFIIGAFLSILGTIVLLVHFTTSASEHFLPANLYGGILLIGTGFSLLFASFFCH